MRSMPGLSGNSPRAAGPFRVYLIAPGAPSFSAAAVLPRDVFRGNCQIYFPIQPRAGEGPEK